MLPTPRLLSLAALAAAVLVSTAGCMACPAKNELSKEAQLAMLKDEGYYAEEQKDGRWFVFGTKKSHEGFQKSGHLQVSKTFIGEGPGGATVVLEAKDKLPEMTERLAKTFGERHGVVLQ